MVLGLSSKKAKSSAKKFCFRLYIAGQSEHSVRAKSNIESLCKEIPDFDYELEIIDIVDNPRRCLDDGIIVTPMLIKTSPPPEVKVMGDLGDTRSMRLALGI